MKKAQDSALQETDFLLSKSKQIQLLGMGMVQVDQYQTKDGPVTIGSSETNGIRQQFVSKKPIETLEQLGRPDSMPVNMDQRERRSTRRRSYSNDILL